MQRLISAIIPIVAMLSMAAETTVIHSPGYFTDPIRDGYVLFPDSLVFSSDAEEITIPDIGMIGKLGQYDFPNLRKITFGNIDYTPGALFQNMPQLEEVVFNGLVGHFDCVMAYNCPKLKRITFRGPVSSTGGPAFAHACPQLESVVFESVVGNFGLGIFKDSECPLLHNYTVKGAFLDVYNDSLTPVASIDHIRSNPRLIADMERLAQWHTEVLTARNPDWMRGNEYQSARVLQPVLAQLGSPMAEKLKTAMDYAWNLGDEVKTEIDLLKEAPAYCHGASMTETFAYAAPSDSLLAASRKRFNLDSIAGNGTDIERIMNLMQWVHNSIPHDGSNGIPAQRRNLRDIYDTCRRDSVGVNCRGLAICLTEALLAQGIPARYITCMSKKWDTDPDCHVICVAWSQSLGKWIWVDPTFAAVVTDSEGNLLHPGEVRHRLQHDLPLAINPDANWNNLAPQTKDHYIDYYMAKNLYLLEANLLNQADPEGPASHPQGRFAALVPPASNYNRAQILTSDDAWFWQPPAM